MGKGRETRQKEEVGEVRKKDQKFPEKMRLRGRAEGDIGGRG